MKVTKTTEKINHKEVTTFFVDGIKVATCKKYSEYFCTIKNGSPSNIRDKVKTARETSWHRLGLEQVLGNEIKFTIGSPRRDGDFKDDYPDTSWGYGGSSITANGIKELIEKVGGVKCDECGKGGGTHKKHSCPFSSEINSDDSKTCNCCKECEGKCSDEI